MEIDTIGKDESERDKTDDPNNPAAMMNQGFDYATAN